MVSVGYQGLYQAALKFDTKKSNDFKGFAWKYIDYAVKTYQRNIDELHHITRNHIKDIKQVRDTLMQRFGREPTDMEIAEHLNMSSDDVQKYINIEWNSYRVEDDHKVLSEITVEAESGESIEEDRSIKLGKDMDDCLEYSLTAEQKKIIELMYLENLTAAEIAFKLWSRFENKEKNLVYNSTKSGKMKLKKCMEEKGWTITDI